MSSCNCHDGAGRLSHTDVGELEWPRYSPGLILEDSDLTAAVDYTRELNRLLFRSLFGCGVVCGFDVAVRDDCGLQVLVAPGLALDGCGNPLHLTRQAAIKLEGRDGVLSESTGKKPKKPDFWVIACSREKTCANRALVCDCDELDPASQPTRTRSAVEISVSFEPPACGCSCTGFADKPDSAELDRRAKGLRDLQARERGAPQGSSLGYAERCHSAHNSDADCQPDCGCGTACSCGCCVVLGWGHWFAEDKSHKPGWHMLHYGVRRFVRPMLMADPRRDFKAQPTAAAPVTEAKEDPAKPAKPARREAKPA